MKKPQVVYISAHRADDPRRVANVKLYPLRQTYQIVYATNFQPQIVNVSGRIRTELNNKPTNWLMELISERLWRSASERRQTHSACMWLIWSRSHLPQCTSLKGSSELKLWLHVQFLHAIIARVTIALVHQHRSFMWHLDRASYSEKVKVVP